MNNPTVSEPVEEAQPRIVKTPGTCGGKPRIAGHRIRVQDVVVWHERQHMSPSAIIDEYPGLTIEDVESALSYYRENRGEIEILLREEDDLADFVDRNRLSVLIRPPGTRDVQDHSPSPR